MSRPRKDTGLVVPRFQAARCRAKSKRRPGEQCSGWAMRGKTLCYYHGGRSEKVPAEHLITHGLQSQFVKISEIPAILARVAELRTAEGKEDALLVGAALMEARLEKVPDEAEFIEKFVAARKSIREDLKTSHELAAKAVVPQMPVFQIGTFEAAAPFLARDASGAAIQVQTLNGRHYAVLDGGARLEEVVEQVDADTGAKVYARVLTERSAER